MAKEIYSSAERAAIGDHCKAIDQLGDPDMFLNVFYSINFYQEFGAPNFAGIEQIFRERGFNTHCLAIPERMVNQRLDSIVAIHPEDMALVFQNPPDVPIERVLKNLRKTSHVVYFYSSREVVELAAEVWGFCYDPVINMADLHEAGMIIAKPGTPVARRVNGMIGLN